MIYILITLVLGFAAVNTGNNLLYLMVSALLGFMAVSGLLGKWNLDGLQVSLEIPEEVYDGVATMIVVVLQNRRRLPTFLMEVLVDEHKVLFPLIDPDGRVRRGLHLTFIGRGVREISFVRVRSRFPINFFIRSRGLPLGQPLTVFPRPEPCPYDSPAAPQSDKGSRATIRRGTEGEVTRISDYRGGEPLKLIHWKLSARHGELKVKELGAPLQEPLVLDLAALPGTDVEQRLRQGAFLVDCWLRKNRPLGLRLDDLEIGPDIGRTHKLRLLEALAGYGQG